MPRNGCYCSDAICSDARWVTPTSTPMGRPLRPDLGGAPKFRRSYLCDLTLSARALPLLLGHSRMHIWSSCEAATCCSALWCPDARRTVALFRLRPRHLGALGPSTRWPASLGSCLLGAAASAQALCCPALFRPDALSLGRFVALMLLRRSPLRRSVALALYRSDALWLCRSLVLTPTAPVLHMSHRCARVPRVLSHNGK